MAEPIRSVLLVCTGNTCRSTMAHALLAARMRDRPVRVASAGTNTIDGLPASAGAAAAMAELGLDLSGFHSHALTREMVRDAGLILVMEPRHVRRVLEFDPDAAARTYLLAEYGGGPGGPVEDPIGSELDVYREVAKIIAQCLDRVAEDIAERTAVRVPSPGSVSGTEADHGD